jgi:hypothetical protein
MPLNTVWNKHFTCIWSVLLDYVPFYRIENKRTSAIYRVPRAEEPLHIELNDQTTKYQLQVQAPSRDARIPSVKLCSLWYRWSQVPLRAILKVVTARYSETRHQSKECHIPVRTPNIAEIILLRTAVFGCQTVRWYIRNNCGSWMCERDHSSPCKEFSPE